MVRYGRQLKIVFFDDYSTSYLLPPTFEKWYPAKTPISLMPYGEAHHVKSTGLVYDLDHPVLSLGTQTSSSNEARADGIVKISYESGTLILMECHD
jgi:thiamine pyrophosphokinase